jgi:hypothetical protein
LGYLTDSSGRTTISFAVTNKCKFGVSHISIGTDTFTRIAPADGSVYRGNLGSYKVSWTRATGNPTFIGIKFEPASKNFNNGAREIFRIVVTNFASNRTIRVVGAGGKVEETFSFLLSQTSCSSAANPELPFQSDTPLWERLLVWLGLEHNNMSWFEQREGPIYFSSGNGSFPALSRDGTLNWGWMKLPQARAPAKRFDGVG